MAGLEVDLLQAFIASIGYAGGVAIDKILLCRDKLQIRVFIPLLFILLTLITAVLLPRFGSVNWQIINLKYVLIFALMIAVATTWNMLYYRGIQRESLHELELIMLLSPLVTIIFAMIFLPSERNLAVFIAGLVASIAFIWSRFRSHHLKLSLTAKGTVLAMILISFESILIKELLDVFSPTALYFTRTMIVAGVFCFMYRPKLKSTPLPLVGLTLISALFGVLQMVLKYYGFKNLGVIETTIVLLLGPFMVYAFSYFYFHEKPMYKRDVTCALIVIACIIYSTLAS